MSLFRSMLSEVNQKSIQRWCFVAYDQLHLDLGPWGDRGRDGMPRTQVGLILIETPWKATRRPYHKQKLALLLTNLRHFALEAQAAGHPVVVLHGSGSYGEQLSAWREDIPRIHGMIPAERELRVDLQPLADSGRLQLHPHDGWLTNASEFHEAVGETPPWRADAFYRSVRKARRILTDADGRPAGGKWSFDAENRAPWKGSPPLPATPVFPVDALTEEVIALVEARFTDHPGQIDRETLPATLQDAEAQWDWAIRTCMHEFGTYEDAMTSTHRSLFHTRISALLNMHRLLPARVLSDAIEADIPLNSKEGFIRQVLGWREFVHHVHARTDGFRDLDLRTTLAPSGDGGWSRIQGKGTPRPSEPSPNHLNAIEPLPVAYWKGGSGMLCLDDAVTSVIEEGYTHHIPRLMVLANLATLLGIDPRETTDWFWSMFTDAYDWVVEPNVLAMGTYAVGGVMTTKPYVSGTPYLHKMGDHCAKCALHPKRTCPISDLYWDFLHRHQDEFKDNPRMFMPMRSLAKRSEERIVRSSAVRDHVLERLRAGAPVTPFDQGTLG